ncbi:hypothetical protein TrST_g13126 [Triparma strigata]|uniref:Uncharacterized protein n=1 Tax=Triparma strigata TaxID=1606541 RepID=A0A9W7B8F8_9STRA|nr:hypothetical protein TrST_g13126 [Triparma strigata]
MAAMNVDGKDAHLKLLKWSDTIKDDFVLGNAIALGRKSPGDSDLQTIIMNQASCITNLANKIDGMMNKLEALEGAVTSMDASAVALQHRKRGGGGEEGEEGERKKIKILGTDFTSKAPPASKPAIKGERKEYSKKELLKAYLFRQSKEGHVYEKNLENIRDSMQSEPSKVARTMKQVKVTINDKDDAAGTWEKLSVRNTNDDERRKICNLVVGYVDADVRRMEGQPPLEPGQKSRTTLTVVSIANRIQKAQAGKKETEAKNTSIMGKFFGGGK